MDVSSLYQKRQNLLFCNLMALGFDREAMSKEHKITFDKKMFCLPNQKAFEVITVFLFSQLNEVSDKKYVLLWPLLDFSDHRQFQKTCFTYLSNIAQESEIKFPLFSSSVLSSFGEAFYKLYVAFSSHVVLKTNKKYDTSILKRPKMTIRYFENAVDVLQISTIASVEKFREVVDISTNHLQSYFTSAKKLVTCINTVKLSKSSNEALLEEKFKEALLFTKNNTSLNNSMSENISSTNEEFQEKVEQKWKLIESFLLKEENFWNCLSSELDEDIIKPALRGNEYNVSIPDFLKEEFFKNYQTNFTEENILNIPRFLKILRLTLELYLKNIKESNFSQTYLFNSLKSNTLELKNFLEALQSSNFLLEKMNLEEKKNVEGLLNDIKDYDNELQEYYEKLLPSVCFNSENVDKEIKVFDFSFDEKYLTHLLKQEEEHVKMKKEKSCVATISLDLTQSSFNSDCDQLNLFFEKSLSTDADHISEKNSSLNQKEESCLFDLFSQNTEEQKEKSQSGFYGFDIPESLLLEESLNSQSLPYPISNGSDSE